MGRHEGDGAARTIYEICDHWRLVGPRDTHSQLWKRFFWRLREKAQIKGQIYGFSHVALRLSWDTKNVEKCENIMTKLRGDIKGEWHPPKKSLKLFSNPTSTSWNNEMNSIPINTIWRPSKQHFSHLSSTWILHDSFGLHWTILLSVGDASSILSHFLIPTFIILPINYLPCYLFSLFQNFSMVGRWLWQRLVKRKWKMW